MPSNAHDIKVKNAAFAKDVRQGKPATRPSKRETAEKKTVISNTTLAIVAFVVIGGVLFELAQIMFL